VNYYASATTMAMKSPLYRNSYSLLSLFLFLCSFLFILANSLNVVLISYMPAEKKMQNIMRQAV